MDPWQAIPREEFRQRQDRAREAAQEAGLDGLVVYSRGGAFSDMCADVLYLTNHYSNQPYMPDHSGVGNARSHGVVVLPVDGDMILINDVPWQQDSFNVAKTSLLTGYRSQRVDFRSVLPLYKTWIKQGYTSDPRHARFEIIKNLDMLEVASHIKETLWQSSTSLFIVGDRENLNLEVFSADFDIKTLEAADVFTF